MTNQEEIKTRLYNLKMKILRSDIIDEIKCDLANDIFEISECIEIIGRRVVIVGAGESFKHENLQEMLGAFEQSYPDDLREEIAKCNAEILIKKWDIDPEIFELDEIKDKKPKPQHQQRVKTRTRPFVQKHAVRVHQRR